jgi:hypothetical protein
MISQKARTQSGKPSGKARISSAKGTTSPSSRGTSGTTSTIKAPHAKSSGDQRVAASGHVTPQRSDTTQEGLALPPTRSDEEQASQRTVTSPKREVDKAPEVDETSTSRRRASTAEETPMETEGLNPALILVQPESSDELERICENIWTLFGDNLRYVAVDREGADYRDTLSILQDLSVGGPGNHEGGGDVSMTSSSQDTAATSGSTNSISVQLENAGPPSSTTAIAARILFILLTSPPPHIMEFDELTLIGVKWWTSQGCEMLKRYSMGREVPSDVGDKPSTLANKAVYSLIAKKLLRIQFRVGKRIVSFPAHII